MDRQTATLESMPMDSGDKGLGIGAGILADLAALEARWPKMPEGGWTVAEDCYGHVAGKIRDQIKATLAVANNADPTQGEDAHVAKAQAAAEKLAEAVSEAEAKLVQAEIDAAVALTEDFNKADGLVPDPHASELRGILRGMTSSKRLEFLNSVFEAGDRASLAAMLKVPPILSGLDAKTHGQYLESWRQKTCPGIVSARERHNETFTNVNSVLELAQQATKLFDGKAGQRNIEQARLKAAQAAERLQASNSVVPHMGRA